MTDLLFYKNPYIGPPQPDPEPKPERSKRSYIYGSLIAGTAIELAIIIAVTALIAWLCSVLDRNFDDLFPFQTDFAIILLLAVVTVVFFDVRLQHEYYLQVMLSLNQITHGLRRLVRIGTLDPNKGTELLRIVKEGILNKPDTSITAAFETVEWDNLSTTAQILETHLHLLERTPISILSQITIYLWAFSLPWAYFGYFDMFVIGIVPLLTLPFLALRQYGCKLRYKGRQWHQSDPFWKELTEKLSFTIENPPSKG